MYKTLIELNRSIADDILIQLKNIIENSFKNRVGVVVNTSKNPYCFEFIGTKDEKGCLEIANLELEKNKLFLDNLSSWEWVVDGNSFESCNILDVFNRVNMRN